ISWLEGITIGVTRIGIGMASITRVFFQAEDGIRDFHVTGVQTCALPISQREYYLNEQMKAIQKELGEMDDAPNDLEELARRIARSEERRVGIEDGPRGPVARLYMGAQRTGYAHIMTVMHVRHGRGSTL